MQIVTEQDHKTESLDLLLKNNSLFQTARLLLTSRLAFIKMRVCWFFCDRPRSFPPLSVSRPLEYVQDGQQNRGEVDTSVPSLTRPALGTSFNAITYSKPNGCHLGKGNGKEGREGEASGLFQRYSHNAQALCRTPLISFTTSPRDLSLSSCSPSSLKVEPKPVVQLHSAGVQRIQENGVYVFKSEKAADSLLLRGVPRSRAPEPG